MAAIRLEAETLSLTTYIQETFASASGSTLIRIPATQVRNGTVGQALGTFSGANGFYRVTVGYYDENDGAGTLGLSIGNSTDSLVLDEATSSAGASVDNFRTWTAFNQIQLVNGQSFTLTGTPAGEEAMRVDYIEFELVEPVENTAPIAVADSYTAQVDTPLVIDVAQGLLANDSDSDDDSLIVTLENDPTDGSIVLNEDGSFTYTPKSGSTQTDTFTYTISDGIATDTATVTINFDAVQPPTPPTTSTVGVVTFDQVVQYAAIARNIPYQGNLAELGTEIGGINVASIFDEVYYLTNNSDVAGAISNGAFSYGFQHFINFGYKEGRNPSAFYDEQYYLSNNPDVKAAVDSQGFSSGLQHFLLNGHRENRNPSALFNANDYLTNNPDVDAAVKANQLGSAFEHYVEFGADEGRSPNLLLFNESYYLANNGDVKAAVDQGAIASGFVHYVSFGQKEGRDPSSLFDESAYLDANPDVAGAVGPNGFNSGFEHYVLFGRFEGRSFAA